MLVDIGELSPFLIESYSHCFHYSLCAIIKLVYVIVPLLTVTAQDFVFSHIKKKKAMQLVS